MLLRASELSWGEPLNAEFRDGSKHGHCGCITERIPTQSGWNKIKKTFSEELLKNSEKEVARWRGEPSRQRALHEQRQGSENGIAGVGCGKPVSAAEVWSSWHGGVIIFSKQKLRIYGPAVAECSKSGMSLKILEMMSLTYWVVRAQSTTSSTYSYPYTQLRNSRPPENKPPQARFLEILFTSSLINYFLFFTIIHTNRPSVGNRLNKSCYLQIRYATVLLYLVITWDNMTQNHFT